MLKSLIYISKRKQEKCQNTKGKQINQDTKNIGKYNTKENINEEGFRYDNLAENVKIHNINQVLTTDTTEYKLEIDGKQNISFIADAYSGEILVSSIGKNLNAEFISYNLDLLKQTNYDFNKIITHSDRCGMYKSGIYKTKTTDMNLIPSMSAPFTYTHNPWIETINGQFKDFIKLNIPRTLDELQIALNQFVYYNNNIKIKRKLKTTPIKYRCCNQYIIFYFVYKFFDAVLNPCFFHIYNNYLCLNLY